MSVPPQTLEEIRRRISLAQVVGRHVRLQKRGRDFIGLCPFHKEKTPSFNVVEEKAFYHCFGCGAHGDVIGFVMRVENLGFREVVEQLARQAGVKLPEESPKARDENIRRLAMYEACSAAAEQFQRQLWSAEGSDALAYIRGRGVSDEIIKRFGLGWAPNSWNFIKNALGQRYPEQLLIDVGLLKEGDRGTYDFFRGRLIFPIVDRSGRVIAFGARILGEGEPKYLNSPETEIFNKGRTLFGLHLARSAASADAPLIVTEGYMDVITMHGAGFHTAVAPLGTALTEEHLSELWRISDRPILCFDGDNAGFRAACRALDRALPLITARKTITIVTLEDGEDPDSFLRSHGRAAMEEALRGGIDASEFLWRLATKGERPRSAEQLAIAREILEQKIAEIVDKNVQNSYRTILFSRFWQLYREHRVYKTPVAREKASISSRTLTSVIRDVKVSLTKNKIGLLLLASAINHPRLLEEDIDRFVALRPQTDAAVELHQEIINVVSVDPDIEGGELLDRLWERHSKLLTSIFSSQAYRCTLTAHPHAEFREAKLGWEALFNRLLVITLERELEEALEVFKADLSPDAFDRLKLQLEGYIFHREERHLIDQERELIPVRQSWRPPKKVQEVASRHTKEHVSV